MVANSILCMKPVSATTVNTGRLSLNLKYISVSFLEWLLGKFAQQERALLIYRKGLKILAHPTFLH